MLLSFKQYIENLFKNSQTFSDSNKVLFIPKILEAIEKIDIELVKILKNDDRAKKHFFTQIDDIYVLNQNKLIEFFTLNDYMKNGSYTSYTNKIGLIKKDNFIKKFDDVVLAFPHKDCVLEGGQTKDDDKKKEVFYNEILSSDEIDRLFEPKVLTNIKRYSKDGVEENCEIKNDDNLIIKGNNLIALHSLKKKFAQDGEKIKVIYIDPPYYFDQVKAKDSFQYNSNFKLSTWLTFMKNRLEIAREFLSDDGAIFVSLSNDAQHYLRVLLDEIFLPDNHVSDIVWQGLDTVKNDAQYFSDNHEYIFCYAKNKTKLKLKGVKRTTEQEKVYKNPDNDSRGRYLLTPIHAKSGSDNGCYTYKFKNGYVWNPPVGTFPRFSKKTLQELEEDNRIYFGEKENSIPQKKTFLNEVSPYVKLTTFWDYKFAGSTRQSNKELSELIGKGKFSNSKPVKLIKIIIDSLVNDNDIVMDFFGGSGTTAHAVLDINKEQDKKLQFILIEQMDYIEDITKARIKKVIEKNQEGSFVYAELKQIDTFKNVEIGALNKNMQYLPISEIEDETYNVKKEEIEINKKFYGIENE
ncbi:site-specific DNA-methyltransferase [Aliarcobacter skirrowii]|uniref:site-specific DNA-methyltransferase n=1 Tax=Aliarcobacter skirrowii TaxID=28200 RepID=UPI000826E22E|nr:site-specific DNA-methyltransferase [Aliarcobacter skirrowii]